MENSMDIPKKIKNKNYHITQQLHFWVFLQKKYKD